MQVAFGFPPFYRRFADMHSWNHEKYAYEGEERLRLVMPLLFASMGMLFLLGITKQMVFFSLAGLLMVWAGLRLRQDLARTTDGPLPWLRNAVTVRFPMLVFDVWTLMFSLPIALGPLWR